METHITDVFTTKTPDPSYISSDIGLGKISLSSPLLCGCYVIECIIFQIKIGEDITKEKCSEHMFLWFPGETIITHFI